MWSLRGLPRALGGRSLELAPGAMGFASQMLAGGAVLMVASALVAFSAFMVLLQRTPTAVSSSYAYVNPLIGLGLGVTLGG